MSFRRAFMFTADAVVTGGLLVWAYRAFGPASVSFALVVVWIPMVGLGTISHVVAPRLPERFHRLRPFELDGRVYERLGVRVAKRMLRRGPLSVFNPGLHMPRERTPEQIARLEQKMRDAEASHAILLVVTLAPVVNAAVRGWWLAATSTLVFNLIANGYPVILQRYNRALLQRRFDHPISGSLSR